MVSRCTGPDQWPRTSRTANTMSCGCGVQGHTRSRANDGSRTRVLATSVALLCLLSYIRKWCKACRRPVPGLPCGNVLKSGHRKRWSDPSIAGLCRCAGRLKPEKKRARILSASGPLRTELGGCAARRFPLPDALDPRSDQAGASLSGRPRAWLRRRRPAIPSPQLVRTRPDPAGVGWF